MMLRSDDAFSIAVLTKGNPPLGGLPFRRIKEAVLGKAYRLSLVICTERRSRRLNRIFRGKDAPTDILSFPLGKGSGEVFLCPKAAQREAARFGRSERNFLQFLFIHGLLHLKGLCHGRRMEHEERKFRTRFGI